MRHDSCPDCHDTISAKYKRCSCGWSKSKEHIVVKSEAGCSYQLNCKHCRLSGGISPSTHASTTWYCYGHYRSLGNPREAEEWFHYVEEHYDEIMAEREDWRRKLHQDFKSIIVRSVSNEQVQVI